MNALILKIKGFFRKIYLRKAKRSDVFNIIGTVNLNTTKDFYSNDLGFLFSPKYEVFQELILGKFLIKKSISILKFGDGDYYFLKGLPVGSAKPGNRALSKNYESIDLDLFRNGWNHIDYLACEIPLADRNRFYEISPNRSPNFPAEYIYASVANRWFFSSLGSELAVIGASEKIQIIEELQKSEIYRDYLGITQPFDAIKISQKFACDDINQTIEKTIKQVQQSNAKIFFLGVGHAKSALLPALQKSHPGIYIDIGSGIDALAGVIDSRRPYFGDWTNFKLSNQELYKNIDYLQVKNFGKTLVV